MIIKGLDLKLLHVPRSANDQDNRGSLLHQETISRLGVYHPKGGEWIICCLFSAWSFWVGTQFLLGLCFPEHYLEYAVAIYGYTPDISFRFITLQLR